MPMTNLEVATCHVIQSMFHEMKDLNQNLKKNNELLKEMVDIMKKSAQPAANAKPPRP